MFEWGLGGFVLPWEVSAGRTNAQVFNEPAGLPALPLFDEAIKKSVIVGLMVSYIAGVFSLIQNHY